VCRRLPAQPKSGIVSLTKLSPFRYRKGLLKPRSQNIWKIFDDF
jgi:hypothetical protein